MLTKMIDGLSSKLADQWVLTLFTPAFVFWSGGLLAWVWRFGWSTLAKQFMALSPAGQIVVLIGALLVVGVSAVVIQRFDLIAVRSLEGYWPRWLRQAKQWRLNRMIDAYNRKFKQFQDLATKGINTLSAEEVAEYADLDRYLLHMPSSQLFFLPTRLGNTLRAAELHPKDKYGLESIMCWPRLWLVMPDEARKELVDARGVLDTAARLCTWSVLFLVWTVWAWWAPIVTILVAIYAYRWAISAAEIYGDLLESAYDLYRPLLYQSLRWPLPANPAEEYQAGLQITQYLWRGSHATTPTFTTPPKS